MALDTYPKIVGQLQARCDAVSYLHAQNVVSHAYRQIVERRRWSWLVKFGQFIAPALYNTGTVSVTNGSPVVTGSGTTWTQSMIGEQFRIGVFAPIYTIAQWNSATQITLDSVWGGATASGQGYQIYQCYFTTPSDFHQFISLWDPNFNYQLRLNVHQEQLNSWDPQRANNGQAYVVAWRDYSTSQVGTVGKVLQALGSGPAPVSTGTYTGPNNAVFTVQVTTGGTSTNAVFKWKQDAGAFTTGVTTDTNAQALQNGVSIYWPDTVTYVNGDTFTIVCSVASAVGLPRYEIWPHQLNSYVYPFLYESRPPDLEDTGATLPRYIRGDVLLEMGMAEIAKWPGPSVDNPNPYFNLALSDRHERRAETMIMELERQDDEVFQINASYPMLDWPYAPVLGDSNWVQSHAVGLILGGFFCLHSLFTLLT